MIDYPEKPAAGDAVEIPIEAEVVSDSQRYWLIPMILGIVGLGFIFFLTVFILLRHFGNASPGVGGRIAGTWVHVDQPPSRAAQALMSIGEVQSDRTYVFSRFGSVTERSYYNNYEDPDVGIKGTWKRDESLSGADDEYSIYLKFPDREPRLMHIRFIDSRNAEFRFHDRYGVSFYKTK